MGLGVQAEDPEIRQRLTDLVICLFKYKSFVINNDTLYTTTPDDLNKKIMPYLKNKCNIIKAFITPPRIRPPISKDNAFEECLDCLEVALKPWNPDMSILCPQFCDKIFDDLNQNSNKILDQIELYCPNLDGVSDDEVAQEI